ncbi:putative PD-(D/E)XK nuclease-like domain-containing protein [Seiridium cardinale]
MQDHAGKVLGCLPSGAAAVQEIYTYLLTDYLPSRYPSMFVKDEKKFLNLVTNVSLPLQPPSDPIEALKLLGETVEDDMFFLQQEPEGHRSIAALCTSPSGFDPSEKLGKLLKDIHTPVPAYDKIGRSMERYFSRVEVGKNAVRTNWSITTSPVLLDLATNHVKDGDVVEEDIQVDISQLRKRKVTLEPSQIIQSWLQSVEPEKAQQQQPQQHLIERPSKRLRACESFQDSFECSFNAPIDLDTPPLSESDKMPRAPSARKRGGEEIDRGSPQAMEPHRLDLNRTPKPLRISLPSPTKRARSNSPTKSRAGLDLLEKPISIVEADYERLPEDVQALYASIEAAADYKQGIVPFEVQERVLGRRFPASCFRQPAPDTTPSASATHNTLCRISKAAAKSARCSRHEHAWNNLVHTPLLELVFGSEDDDADQERRPDRFTAGFEPIMSATIAGDSIPRLSGIGGLACTVSVSSTGDSAGQSRSSDARETPIRERDVDITQVHSSSDSKKVDYALVLEMPDDSSLSNIVHTLTKEIAIKDKEPASHVNQTTYLPVQYTPIAVSIETKAQFSAQDPLVQLGIWTAAWHKRMDYLRDHLSWGSTSSSEQRLRLVTLPVIQVVGHQWHVYFAYDAGTSIVVHGPTTLGSTEKLLSLYALWTSLQAIKLWIETEFRQGMEKWFRVG